MFKLIILLTTFSPSADYIPATIYASEQDCIGAKEYKVKNLKEYVMYDDKETNVTAYCVEVK